MRRFYLQRDEDVNDFSGTGRVVDGVQFTDGVCVMRWRVGDHRSTVVWNSIESLLAVHGHDGATRVVWIDEEEPE